MLFLADSIDESGCQIETLKSSCVSWLNGLR